jgi:hypothetical protein
VNTGTRALEPELVILARAIPAIRRTPKAGEDSLGNGPMLMAALVAVLVSTSSVAITWQASVLPACSTGGV